MTLVSTDTKLNLDITPLVDAVIIQLGFYYISLMAWTEKGSHNTVHHVVWCEILPSTYISRKFLAECLHIFQKMRIAAPDLLVDWTLEQENYLFLNDWETSNPACWWVLLCHLCSVRKQPKHLQLIVRLVHCTHRAILTLPRWEPRIICSTVSHRERIVGNFIILNTGYWISTEGWEAEK